jgi:hypothetical protein
LSTTPANPEYPGGHASFAGAAEHALRTLVGPRPPRPFTLTSSGAPGVTRHYGRDAWARLVNENVNAHVWGGIHFRSTSETSAALGRRVAATGLARLRESIGQ